MGTECSGAVAVALRTLVEILAYKCIALLSMSIHCKTVVCYIIPNHDTATTTSLPAMEPVLERSQSSSERLKTACLVTPW